MVTITKPNARRRTAAQRRIAELVRQFEARGYEVLQGSGGDIELILRNGMPFDLNRSPQADRPLFDELWLLADELEWC